MLICSCVSFVSITDPIMAFKVLKGCVAFLLIMSTMVTEAGAVPYNEIYGHLKAMEGFCLVGYIPSALSGITIATGIDLGQWSPQELLNMGVPPDILAIIQPYMKYHTRAEAEKAGVNPKSLKLTKDQAQRLDQPFLIKNIDVLTPYFGRLSAKGEAVLVSLRHWNGSLKNSFDDGKLTRYVNGQLISYVWEAVKDKNATDTALFTALKKTQATHTPRTSAYNRLGHEANYLDGSTPTPPDSCPLCLKDKDYCY